MRAETLSSPSAERRRCRQPLAIANCRLPLAARDSCEHHLPRHEYGDRTPLPRDRLPVSGRALTDRRWRPVRPRRFCPVTLRSDMDPLGSRGVSRARPPHRHVLSSRKVAVPYEHILQSRTGRKRDGTDQNLSHNPCHSRAVAGATSHGPNVAAAYYQLEQGGTYKYLARGNRGARRACRPSSELSGGPHRAVDRKHLGRYDGRRSAPSIRSRSSVARSRILPRRPTKNENAAAARVPPGSALRTTSADVPGQR